VDRPIGIFDSGVGGLSVLSACKKEMQNECFVYLFDESGAPYGSKSDRYILNRAEYLTKYLIDLECKAVIVACNTATSVAVDFLRNEYKIPIFGVEPPVIPAVRASNGGKILVLATEATARQERIGRLIDRCKNRNIVLSPQKNLALLIEKNFDNLEQIRDWVYEILEQYDGVESVVLGCTHYNHIKKMIEDFYGGNAKVYDCSEAVSKHVKHVLSDLGLLTNEKAAGCDIKIHL